jgi:hypothetical protein
MRIRVLSLELLFLSAGLIFLAVIDPDAAGLPSLCLAKAVGFDACPGCGLGASISYALHGDLARSWSAHPLGVFALVVLVRRIVFIVHSKNHLPTH